MKKLIYPLAIACFALSLSSCQKEEIDASMFSASMEKVSGNDKTYFAYNTQGGGSFWWKSNDNFKIWTGPNQGSNYSIQLPDGESWQTVTGDPDEGLFALDVELVTDDANPLTGNTFYAFYPGYKSEWNGSAPTVVLDANQVLDNFDPDGYSALHATNPSLTQAQYASARLQMVNLKRFPMYAKTTNNTLQFKHLCGALMVKLQQNDKSIRAIEFTTANQKVSGTFEVNTSVNADANPLVVGTPATKDERSTKIEFSYPVPIDNATMFWLRLPAGTYSDFTITITDGDYNTVELSPNGGSVIIQRAKVTPVDFSTNDFTYTTPEGIGKFTVEIDNQGHSTKKVYFSPGNLQFVDNHWKFADHQYEVIHGYNGTSYTTAATNYSQDLFGWSTANSQYGQSTNASDYTDNTRTTPFVEWGRLFGDNTWFTMTVSEWEVLLFQRSTSFTAHNKTVRWAATTIGYTQEVKHNLRYSTDSYWIDGIQYIYNPDIEDDFQRVTINGNVVVYFKYPREQYDYISTQYNYTQDGILIFPDDFTAAQWQQVGADLPNNAINNMANHPDFNGNNMDFVFLSMAQLNALEEMGVVWLPAVGKASLNGNIGHFDNPQNGTSSALYYWTASPYDYMRQYPGTQTTTEGNTDDAFQIYIHNNGGAYSMNGQPRTDRCAVRLVRQAPLN